MHKKLQKRSPPSLFFVFYIPLNIHGMMSLQKNGSLRVVLSVCVVLFIDIVKCVLCSVPYGFDVEHLLVYSS